MEKVKIKFEQFKNALTKFKEAFSFKESEIIRDGTLQRFEFTFECAWKLMQEINLKYGFETYSPRESIKQAFQINLISDNKLWFDVIDDRNLISHTYSEATAKKIYTDIKSYIPLFEELILNANKLITELQK